MNRKVRVSQHVLCETISKTRLSLSSRNPNQKWSWTAHSKHHQICNHSTLHDPSGPHHHSPTWIMRRMCGGPIVNSPWLTMRKQPPENSSQTKTWQVNIVFHIRPHLGTPPRIQPPKNSETQTCMPPMSWAVRREQPLNDRSSTYTPWLKGNISQGMFWKRAAVVSQARPCCSDEHSHTHTHTHLPLRTGRAMLLHLPSNTWSLLDTDITWVKSKHML